MDPGIWPVYAHLAVEKNNKFLHILLLKVFLLIIDTNIISNFYLLNNTCVG